MKRLNAVIERSPPSIVHTGCIENILIQIQRAVDDDISCVAWASRQIWINLETGVLCGHPVTPGTDGGGGV